LRTHFYAFSATFASFSIVNAGMLVKYEFYFANHTIRACFNTFPTRLTQKGIQPDIFSVQLGQYRDDMGLSF